MSYSVVRSTRNRDLFVIATGNKESEMEFPFKEGSKHMRNASRFTRWLDRVVTTRTNINSDARFKSQIETYLPKTSASKSSSPTVHQSQTDFEFDDDIHS